MEVWFEMVAERGSRWGKEGEEQNKRQRCRRRMGLENEFWKNATRSR